MKQEQNIYTVFSQTRCLTGVNSFNSLAGQVNLWRDAKVPKEGNKHISIRTSSFYITADSDHLIHWKTEEEEEEVTKSILKEQKETMKKPVLYPHTQWCMNHVGSVVFPCMHRCHGIQCGKSAAILCLARHASLASLKFQQTSVSLSAALSTGR